MGEQRLIIATCEKGTVEDLADMKDIKSDIDKIKEANPNFVDIAAHDVFRPRDVEVVADPVPSTKGFFIAKAIKERVPLMERRKDFRVGIPRLLNTYTYAPLFNAYFAALGLKSENILYSDYTTPELYRAGASRGAIDPCYPSKIGIAHVYNLLATKHSKKPLNAIWFPMYDVLHSHLVNLTGSNACPTVTATPESLKPLSPRRAKSSPRTTSSIWTRSSICRTRRSAPTRCTKPGADPRPQPRRKRARPRNWLQGA